MNVSWDDISMIIKLLLDILVVWALIYSVLRIIRNNSRTIQIFKGIIVILLIKMIAMVIGLHALNHLIDIFLNWGVVAVLILFQPEIRSMLEKVGKTTTIFNMNVSEGEYVHMIDQLVDACAAMSKTKTGALITIQQSQSLEDYIETGIRMDSEVSSELIKTIFQYGTPMHDGAVIIQGVKIACAAAYFPPTTKDLPSKYGARHRAAVGISEITDSITIIVSEETGNISVAIRGQLTQYKPEGLQRLLTNKLIVNETKATLFDPVLRTARSFSLNRTRRSEERAPQKNGDERIKPIEIVDLYSHSGGKEHGPQ